MRNHEQRRKHAVNVILAALCSLLAGCGRAQEPPPPAPYTLPPLAGRLDMTPPPAEFHRPRQVEAKRLFEAVIACYPAKSWFRGELAAMARVGTGAVADLTDTTATGGKAYVGLVARVPLFSSNEADRERQWETERRGRVADAVAKLNEAVTVRAVAERKRALYAAIESRAALRVRHGIAHTSEQVEAMKAVAEAEAALARAEADITAARLTLRGLCGDERADSLDALIDGMLRP